MIKALFFDIDGTLVSFRTHTIPASTIEALTAAKARGLKIFIATGRPPVLITNLGQLEELHLIDGFVSMNGAYCFVGSEVIYKSPIDPVEVTTLAAYCHHHQVPCIVVGEHDIAVSHTNELVERIFNELLGVGFPIPPLVSPRELQGKEVYQLTPFLTAEQEAEIRSQLPGCEFGRWHPAFLDLTARGNNKQQGIDLMARHFGLTPQECMTFGDGGNDIPMLRHAGIGVAMGNASDEVKAAADYVTASVDEDGILLALKHLSII